MTPEQWVDMLYWPGIALGAALGMRIGDWWDDWTAYLRGRRFRRDNPDFTGFYGAQSMVCNEARQILEREIQKPSVYVRKGMVQKEPKT